MFVLTALLASACSGGGGDQTDAGDDGGADAAPDAPVYPAPHPPMAQAVSLGGPVMASPKLVAISFDGDSLQSDVDAFASQLASVPSYWSGAVGEYGVGAIASSTFHSSDTPAQDLTDGDVRTWLTDEIQNDASFPQPDGDTIYTLFYPDGVNVTAGFGVTCNEFQGYHDSFPLTASVNVVYAIVPRCPPPPVQGVTAADQMTA